VIRRLVLAGVVACAAACVSEAPDTSDASPAGEDGGPRAKDGSTVSESGVDARALDAGDANSCPAAGALAGTHAPAFSYGRHYPNGMAAVAYAYGPDGMWKEMKPLEYTTSPPRAR
jgi:hypothetical protein